MPEENKAPRGTESGEDPGWTAGRSFFLLLVLLDITVGIVWFAYNFSAWESFQTVVIGVWTAGLALLSFLKLEVRGDTTFPEFFGLLPVRFVVGTYSALVMGLVAYWGGTTLPVYHVELVAAEVTSEGRPAPEEVTVRVLTEEGEPGAVLRNGDSWTPRLRHGSHDIVVSADGFFADTVPETVGIGDLIIGLGGPRAADLPRPRPRPGWIAVGGSLPANAEFDLLLEYGGTPLVTVRREEDVTVLERAPGSYVLVARAPGFVPDTVRVDVVAGETTRPSLDLRRLAQEEAVGRLVLDPSPAGMGILLDDRSRSEVTPTTLALSPGTYDLEFRRRSDNAEELGYHFRETVRVEDGGETVVRPALEVIDLPVLVIPHGIGEPPATYYLDRVSPETLLGQVTGLRRFHVFPGTYTVVREVEGEVENVERVSLSAGGEHVLGS